MVTIRFRRRSKSIWCGVKANLCDMADTCTTKDDTVHRMNFISPPGWNLETITNCSWSEEEGNLVHTCPCKEACLLPCPLTVTDDIVGYCGGSTNNSLLCVFNEAFI